MRRNASEAELAEWADVAFLKYERDIGVFENDRERELHYMAFRCGFLKGLIRGAETRR